MNVGSAHGWSYTAPVGTVFTDGLEILSLSEDGTATIDDIELIGDDGIELIGAKIAPPPRPLASTQLVKRWPPVQKGSFDPSTLVDAVGAEIGSSADEPMGWELFIGIRVAEEGMLHRSGIKVTYHVGSNHYATTIPGELMICTSERYEVDGRCPFDKT